MCLVLLLQNCLPHLATKVRKYWFKHAKLDAAETQAVWNAHIHPDLLCMERSQSKPELESKWTAIRQEWLSVGLAHATSHVDGNGNSEHLLIYFQKEWMDMLTGWHGGQSAWPLPNTNNAIESQVWYTRDDFGNVPGTAIQLVRFMVNQMSYFAKEQWDPKAERPVDKALWQRAMEFKKLHHTSKVRSVTEGGQRLYMCWERSGDAVSDRKAMTVDEARQLKEMHHKLRHGEPVTYQELQEYGKARISSPMCVLPDAPAAPATDSYGGECSCPAFHPNRRCLHTLSFKHAPIEADATLLTAGVRGRKRKARDRYAGPDDYLPRAKTSLASLRSTAPTQRLRRKTEGSVRPL